MGEGIWVAIIGAIQALTLGFVGKISRDSSETRKEVKNDHKTNLRDDIDTNHRQVMGVVQRVEAEVSGMKKDIGRLDDRDLEHGRHHNRVDGKLASIRADLSDHLAWSREYVEAQERKQNGK